MLSLTSGPRRRCHRRTPSIPCLLLSVALLALLTDAVVGQFKIIGLLDTNAAAAVASPQQQRALDTSSPLIQIGALAGDDPVEQSRGFDAVEPAVTELQPTLNGTVPVVSIVPIVPVVPLAVSPPATTTENGIIKMRVMGELKLGSSSRITLPLHPMGNDIVPKRRLSQLTGTIPSETAGIVVLMDKQSRNYAKSYKPNIRKFTYSEERSFHRTGQNTLADSDAVLLAHQRRHEQKLKKITKYRNSFKTRCRCERISNCPRIQITIHRCAQDYFMCCF